MLRFINSFKPSLYSSLRCWFLHCILRQAVDFYDVECINCTMPIGAAEMHEEYPMAICTMCQSYTTLEAVIADNENAGIASYYVPSPEAVAGMKAYRYIQNLKPSRIKAKGSRVLDDRGTNSEFI